MQKKYQISLIAITLMLVCSILVATSYAYWSVTEVQEDTNILTSGCFDATLEGKNAINLDNAYPMTNEEGKNTTLYSFTIKNTCSIDSSYVVNLEALKGSNLSGDYIKILFNNGTPVLYSSLESVQTVITESVDSKKLISGRLIAGGSITYTLQLWMDESATTDQAGQIFNSKIVVTTEATNMGETLARRIIDSNPLVEITPTLTTSSNNTTDPSGLYKSNLTNDGGYTYYFRGNVTNNYVSFAGNLWRIVRINEDGTVRLILNDNIDDNSYEYNYEATNRDNMYLSFNENNRIKGTLDIWYANNIANNVDYVNKIATGNYFCEQSKVSLSTVSTYNPDFKCGVDSNSKSYAVTDIGLITYDEAVFAGGYYNLANNNYYLNNNKSYWTMSPAGFGTNAYVWSLYSSGLIIDYVTNYTSGIRPVINLKADVTAVGLGTEINPYYIN